MYHLKYLDRERGNRITERRRKENYREQHVLFGGGAISVELRHSMLESPRYCTDKCKQSPAC